MFYSSSLNWHDDWKAVFASHVGSFMWYSMKLRGASAGLWWFYFWVQKIDSTLYSLTNFLVNLLSYFTTEIWKFSSCAIGNPHLSKNKSTLWVVRKESFSFCFSFFLLKRAEEKLQLWAKVEKLLKYWKKYLIQYSIQYSKSFINPKEKLLCLGKIQISKIKLNHHDTKNARTVQFIPPL